MQGLAELVSGMGRLEAAMTVMAPAMATKDEMDIFKTAMQTRFDDMSKRLEAMEAAMQSFDAMSKRLEGMEAAMQNFDARMAHRLETMETAMQSLQAGWEVVPDEDDTGSTVAGHVWDYGWAWLPHLGWQRCRRRRTQ